MRTPGFFLCALVLLSGCDKRESAPAPSTTPSSSSSVAITPDLVTKGGGGAMAQVHLGAGTTKGGSLPFEIVEVHEGVARSEAAPWWKPGGDWTFFDAKAEGGVTMTLGVHVRLKLQSDPPMTLVDAVMVTKDSAEGERLVASLAKALGVDAPPAPGDKKPIAPLDANAVNLMEDAQRSPDGSFSGKGGGWVASKWTFEDPGVESAEIYLNYSLAAKRGEFSRKDKMYDPDVVKFVARALRDGFQKPPAAASASASASQKPKPGSKKAL
jgi:hypothetical protein